MSRDDMKSGIIDRIRTMPLRSGAVLTGHVVASLVRNLLATGVVIGVALLVGFRPTADVWGWIGAVAMIALYILTITYLFAAIGLAAGSPEAASGYGFIILFLPYLSSAFVPVDTMPTWLQWFAENQPITPIIETIRGLLFDLPMGTEPWWALGWCVAILPAPWSGVRGCSAARRVAADSQRIHNRAHNGYLDRRRRVAACRTLTMPPPAMPKPATPKPAIPPPSTPSPPRRALPPSQPGPPRGRRRRRIRRGRRRSPAAG